MFKKVLGIVILLVGLFGILVSIGGTIVSRSVIDQLGASLETTLTLASNSLDAVDETLRLTQSSVEQAGESLVTLAETAINVSTTMNDTQPILDKVTQSATQQIPESLEAIQLALPDVAEAAGAIDDTLRVLDNFELDRQVFGIPIQFDLGINYQPSSPLDATVLALGQSLDGVPEDLRSLESDMLRTSENLALIGDNIETIAGDLDSINQTVNEINPLLDQYIAIVAQTQELITQAQADLSDMLAMLQLAVTVLFVWLGLNQIVPLYIGWTLMTGDDIDDEESEEESDEPAEAKGDDGGDSLDGQELKDEAEVEADES